MNQEQEHTRGQTGHNQGGMGGQGKQQNQGQGRDHMKDRGKPSTTDRMQPNPNRTGGQKPEGDKPTGSERPKF